MAFSADPMDDDAVARDEIWRVFRRFVEAMIDPARGEECLSLVTEDVVGLGMVEQGPYYDKAEFKKLLSCLIKETEGPVYTIEYGRHVVRFHPPGSGNVISELKITCDKRGEISVSHVMQMAGMRRIDGEWRLSCVACSPLVMTRENIEALPLRFADGTLAALKLELRDEAMDLLSDGMPGGMICFHERAGFPISFINGQMLGHLGYTAAEFDAHFNKMFLNLIHPDDRLPVTAAIKSALDKGGDYEINHRIRKRDGHAWVVHRGRRASDGSGLLISVFTDITEIIRLQNELRSQADRLEESLSVQKKQEERLQAAVASAEEASQMKTFFLANMSHEIRTPMNGVVGFVELALADPNLSARTREYLGKIKQSAGGLLEVINDILDISKIESGKMEIEHAPFRLSDVIRQCESITTLRAGEKGVQLIFRHDGENNPTLYGDQTRLRQILLNLLSNAVKFTERGVISLTTKITPLSDKQVRVFFEVADTGIGMSREQVAKIFQPFVQADTSTTRKYGGTGLGLSITKTFIELMGGELKAASSLGVGSRFSFSLDFDSTRPVASDTWILVKSGAFKEKRPLFSGRALVCEDNDINQDVITGHLKRCGMEADVADNGRAGVELARERLASGKNYDLIFMDIYMPVMDGIEATRELRRLGIEAPIVALTANVMKQDRERYLRGGMSAYLAKPFVSEELWACLLKFLKPEGWVENDAAPVAEDAGDGMAVRRDLGLSRSGGNADVFARIAGNFIEKYAKADLNLDDLIQAGDIGEARRLAHTVKGVAGTLGALGLSKAAEALEAALADGEMDMASVALRDFSDELVPVLTELKAIAPAARESAAAPVVGELDSGAATALLRKLLPLLESGDSAVIEFLPEARRVLAPLSGRGGTLLGFIDEYDFERAAGVARELLRELSL